MSLCGNGTDRVVDLTLEVSHILLSSNSKEKEEEEEASEGGGVRARDGKGRPRGRGDSNPHTRATPEPQKIQIIPKRVQSQNPRDARCESQNPKPQWKLLISFSIFFLATQILTDMLERPTGIVPAIH